MPLINTPYGTTRDHTDWSLAPRYSRWFGDPRAPTGWEKDFLKNSTWARQIENLGKVKESYGPDVIDASETGWDAFAASLGQRGKDYLRGKFHGQDLFSPEKGSKYDRLAAQQEGIVKQQTPAPPKLQTLAERLRSFLPTAFQNQPNYTAGQKVKDFGEQAGNIAKGFGEQATMIADIAASSFTGNQIRKTATPGQIQKLATSGKEIVDTRPTYANSLDTRIQDGGPVPASDKWAYLDSAGNYQPHTVQTRNQFPANVSESPSNNPLGIRGESLLQLTADNPYSERYLQYDDPAYVQMSQSSPMQLLGELGSPVNVIGAWGLQGVHGLKNVATGQPWGAGTEFQKGFQPAPEPEATKDHVFKDRNAHILGMQNKTGRLYESQMSPSLRMQYGLPNFSESIQGGETLLKQHLKAKEQQARGSTWDKYLQRNVMQIPDIAATYGGKKKKQDPFDIMIKQIEAYDKPIEGYRDKQIAPRGTSGSLYGV